MLGQEKIPTESVPWYTVFLNAMLSPICTYFVTNFVIYCTDHDVRVVEHGQDSAGDMLPEHSFRQDNWKQGILQILNLYKYNWSSCCSFAKKRTTLQKIISLTSQSIWSPYFWIWLGNPLNLFMKLKLNLELTIWPSIPRRGGIFIPQWWGTVRNLIVWHCITD